jgi:hypothetical protein
MKQQILVTREVFDDVLDNRVYFKVVSSQSDSPMEEEA